MATPRSKNSTNVRIQMAPWAARATVRAADALSPRLAGRVLERLFLTPRRHARPLREEEVLVPAQRFWVKAGHRPVRAFAWGEGPRVLLVHGWEGRGTQLGAFIDRLVARGRRVVAFDAPAHGDSPGRMATVMDFVAAIEALSAVEGPFEAVIAHSFGAPATWIALSRGLAADKVALVAPAGALERHARAFVRALGASHEAGDELVARIEARSGQPIRAVDSAALVPRLHVPALLVHDEQDREVPLEEGRELASAWPGAELVVTRERGHRRILWHPEVIARVCDFVTEPRERRTPRDHFRALYS